MILIPQFYLKNGKVVMPEGLVSTLFRDDPVETARLMREAGAEALLIHDLNVLPVGQSPNLPLIKKIRDLDLNVYVGGPFKTPQAIESALSTGAQMIALGSIAFQQPSFLDGASQQYPGKVGVHLDVKAGRVTIPGYAVVTNKTAYDYAERFLTSGVRCLFYSDVNASGVMAAENFTNVLEFCKKIPARIIVTSEVSGLPDLERLALLGAPRLDGLVLAKSLYEGRIDLKGAIAMVNDISLSSADEPTMAEQ